MTRDLSSDEVEAVRIDAEAWDAACEFASQAHRAGWDDAEQLAHGIRAYQLVLTRRWRARWLRRWAVSLVLAVLAGAVGASIVILIVESFQ